jgi:uncharacterized protein
VIAEEWTLDAFKRTFADLLSGRLGRQMPYLIIVYDKPGMETKRESAREAHRSYLAAQGAKLLASGALLSDEGVIVGGASLLDTDDFDEAAAFEAQDPYAKAGIRVRVEIVKWRLRWWLGEFNSEGHRLSPQ